MAATAREIGIALDINRGTNLDDYNALTALVPEVDDRNIYEPLPAAARVGVYPPVQDPKENTWNDIAARRQVAITIDGCNFYTVGVLGNRGSFGITVEVKDNRGVSYALKRQVATDNDREIGIIKEAIIGRALYNVSNTRAAPFTHGPACLNVYKIVKGIRRNFQKDGTNYNNKRFYYMLMEKGGPNFKNTIDTNAAAAGTMLPYIRTMSTWLHSLYSSNEYVHADFKIDNVLVDSRNHLRFIDYGWNQMVVNGLRIQAYPGRPRNYTNWRDFTLLLFAIKLFCPTAMRNRNNEQFIDDVLRAATNRTYGAAWNLSLYTNRNWFDGYDFLEDRSSQSPNAVPNTVNQELARRGIAEDTNDASDAPGNPCAPPPPAPVVAGPGIGQGIAFGPRRTLGGPFAQPGAAVAQLGGPFAQLGGPAVQLGGPVAQLGGPFAQLGGPVAQLGGPRALAAPATGLGPVAQAQAGLRFPHGYNPLGQVLAAPATRDPQEAARQEAARRAAANAEAKRIANEQAAARAAAAAEAKRIANEQAAARAAAAAEAKRIANEQAAARAAAAAEAKRIAIEAALPPRLDAVIANPIDLVDTDLLSRVFFKVDTFAGTQKMIRPTMARGYRQREVQNPAYDRNLRELQQAIQNYYDYILPEPRGQEEREGIESFKRIIGKYEEKVRDFEVADKRARSGIQESIDALPLSRRKMENTYVLVMRVVEQLRTRRREKDEEKRVREAQEEEAVIYLTTLPRFIPALRARPRETPLDPTDRDNFNRVIQLFDSFFITHLRKPTNEEVRRKANSFLQYALPLDSLAREDAEELIDEFVRKLLAIQAKTEEFSSVLEGIPHKLDYISLGREKGIRGGFPRINLFRNEYENLKAELLEIAESIREIRRKADDIERRLQENPLDAENTRLKERYLEKLKAYSEKRYKGEAASEFWNEVHENGKAWRNYILSEDRRATIDYARLLEKFTAARLALYYKQQEMLENPLNKRISREYDALLADFTQVLEEFRTIRRQINTEREEARQAAIKAEADRIEAERKAANEQAQRDAAVKEYLHKKKKENLETSITLLGGAGGSYYGFTTFGAAVGGTVASTIGTGVISTTVGLGAGLTGAVVVGAAGLLGGMLAGAIIGVVVLDIGRGGSRKTRKNRKNKRK